MKSIVLALIIPCFISVTAQKLTRADYIERYADISMKKMKQTGIPASITLAQGILESGNGNSTLAVKANNHFGIKCHDWKGKKIYHDDDKRNECFRKYNSPEHSYDDHSDFLTRAPRYRFLFDLSPDDYKGWAKGLQKAGYATSSKYSKLLIKIIEDNQLYKYDQMVLKGEKLERQTTKEPAELTKGGTSEGIINNVKYIVVKEGESVEDISRRLGLFSWELPKYNEFEYADSENIQAGQILFIQPKRKKAEHGIHFHKVKEGETLYDIAQLYAIKMEKLCKLNGISPDTEIEPGEQLNLRKKKKGIKKNGLNNKQDNDKINIDNDRDDSQEEQKDEGFQILFDPG